jgi:outer membrane receptor protein involved in Fe transport
MACLLCGAGWPDRDKTWEFDIPRQNVSTALSALAQKTGTQLLFPYEQVKSQDANPLTGRYTLAQALEILLRGTGLTGGVTGSGVITVSLETSANSQDQGEDMQREKKKGLLAGVAAAVLSVFGAQNAPGQESAEAQSTRGTPVLEEIIVTAQKREQRLIDVPMSLAVISNEDIERRGVIGMEDYLRSIPGVNQIDQGGEKNAILIRGIATSPEIQNSGSGTTVASYFDETPITGAAGLAAGGIDVRPVDIERIEVLRGPQGTAYGSASLGGTMRMIPVKPKVDGFSAEVASSLSTTSGLGSDNSMVQGVVNIPVVADKFALRAVGYRYDQSGFYRNIAGIDPATIALAENVGLGDFVRGHVQEDVGRMRTTGGRLAALWQVTDKLNLSLNYLTQKIEQDGAPQASVGKYEQARMPVAPQGRVRGEAGEIADTEMDLLNIALNYDFGWTELTSVASWIDSGAVRTRDFSRFFLFPNSATIPSDFKSFSAETRLASQLEGRFQFLGGLFYEDVDSGFLQTIDWPGAPADSPFGTNPMFIADITRQLDQLAVFGEASYDLTDKLTATVGGRYFKFEKDERTLREGGLAGVPFGAGIPDILEGSEDGSSFKANLSYKPTQDLLLYALWAEGFRLGRPATGLPPAFCDTDGDGLLDGTNITIESTRTINSDFLENYEIGAKWALFDGRMIVDAAVYHIEWDGLPVTTEARALVPNNVDCREKIFATNLGAATSDGVEFQASLVVLEDLRLDFGAGYTKAELSEDAGLLAQEGARLPASPQVSANLAAQYDFEVAGYKAFVRADSFYTGEFFSDLRELPGLSAGDYIKVDARAGVAIRNLSVALFVRNLTNEDALTFHSISGGERGFPGYRLRPRTIGIQLGYSFQ